MPNPSSTLRCLVANMQLLELELRAHSILLEALKEGVIQPNEIPSSLDLARQSPAMLDFVREKYNRIQAQLDKDEARAGAKSLLPTALKGSYLN